MKQNSGGDSDFSYQSILGSLGKPPHHVMKGECVVQTMGFTEEWGIHWFSISSSTSPDIRYTYGVWAALSFMGRAS
jgi:hypothetical protein